MRPAARERKGGRGTGRVFKRGGGGDGDERRRVKALLSIMDDRDSHDEERARDKKKDRPVSKRYRYRYLCPGGLKMQAGLTTTHLPGLVRVHWCTKYLD